MEYRRLGDSGLTVSPICLGAMMFGEPTNSATAARIIASAAAAGINFIDTSDAYAKGESERIVGKAIAKERARWVVGTKVYTKFFPGDPNSGGLSRKWMMYEVDASLSRLKTDYIDIYYFHHDDRRTPLEESVDAMGSLIRAGKVRYFGLSNFQGWRIAEVINTCERLRVPRPIVLQANYNAMNREVEVEMFPAAQHYGLGIVTFSPLARGVLTGKYAPGVEPPRDSRAARKDRTLLQEEFRMESLKLVPRIKAYAEKRGMTVGQFALNWVLNNKYVTSVLAGPRTLPQWREYLAALAYTLNERDEAFVDGLVAPGHASTPGYTNRKFPVTGRAMRNAVS